MLLRTSYPIVRSVLLVYAALLPIVNPFGMAPIFASMTYGYDLPVRRTMAMRVAVNGMVLLIASLFVGSYVLDFFWRQYRGSAVGWRPGGDDLWLAHSESAEQRL